MPDETLDADDIDLPTKEVDPEESVADRMTDNVRNDVGPSRYFQKDANGNPTEDWSDVFERVGQNVAVPEAVHHDIPISVGKEHLASWVSDETAEELFFDHSPPSEHNPDADIDTRYRDLDEEIAKYIDYEKLEALTESAPGSLHERLTDEADRFERMMAEQRFMPNTPTLINAGTELQMLSACFVYHPGDSLIDDPGDRSSILEVAKEAAATFKGGGGVGYPLHLMRPMGDIVSSTGGVSSGPMSFAQIYDTVCGTIKQGGVRRGAQMAIMHAEHPDVGRFCVAKRDEENLSNFNISVGLTDRFLEAVKNDEMYTLVDPTADEAYIDSEPFETVPESIHFYDPQYEDAWNDLYNKPAEDEHGKAIQTNFWRDYYDEMGDPEAFDEFRDRIDLEVGEPLELPARFIWQLLVDGAHHLGEPGFYYIDKANDEHSFDVEENYGEYLHSTNPCGEQSLTDGEPCNLGHVNLSLMADEDAPTFAEWCSDDGRSRTSSHVRDYLEVGLDMELLEETTKTGTRFLDNVITMNDFPLEKNREAANNKRKIGVGIMGFHQLCLQLGIEYGTNESYALAEEVMRLVDRFAVEESYILADERGPFERYEDSKWADPEAYPEWFEKHAHNDPEAFSDGYPVRNHNMTTVAPTGTTSMIGNTTGGCEPIYNVAYFKNVSDDVQGEDMLVEIDDLFLETIEANDLDVDTVTAEIERKLNNDEFTGTDDLETVPDAIGELFVTSSDLSVEQHIRVQAAFQTYCDSSISKCVAEGTIIQTDDGPRRVEDLGHADEAGEFASATDTTIRGDSVTEHYYDGMSSATKVELEGAPDLVAGTENHQVLTTHGWTRVAELEEGNMVVGEFTEGHGTGSEPIDWTDEFYGNAIEIDTPDQMTPELAKIIGMIASDGHLVESTGEVGVSSVDPVVGELFCELTEDVFSVTPHVREDSRNDVVTYYINSRNLYRFFEDLMGTTCREKYTPEQILAGSPEEKLAFVEGLTLDGYIHQGSLVVYGGMSEQLAYETYSLLQSFGVPYVTYGKKYVSDSDEYAYNVTISNELQEMVTPIEAHKDIEAHERNYRVHTNLDELRERLKEERHYTDKAYRAIKTADNQGKNHIYHTTAENAGLDVEDLDPVYRVSGVKDAGETNLYDIEVENTHSYVANGVVNHNTLNIRNNASLADVGEAIGLACELGCKGGTLYRIGSRTEEVKTTSTTGGGVSIKEADEDDLLEELGERGVEIPDTVTVGDD